jgi:hypothetical protein
LSGSSGEDDGFGTSLSAQATWRISSRPPLGLLGTQDSLDLIWMGALEHHLGARDHVCLTMNGGKVGLGVGGFHCGRVERRSIVPGDHTRNNDARPFQLYTRDFAGRQAGAPINFPAAGNRHHPGWLPPRNNSEIKSGTHINKVNSKPGQHPPPPLSNTPTHRPPTRILF